MGKHEILLKRHFILPVVRVSVNKYETHRDFIVFILNESTSTVIPSKLTAMYQHNRFNLDLDSQHLKIFQPFKFSM